MKETFGQRLSRLRKVSGLTQEVLAEKVNVTSQAVSKWENDISLPDIAILISLADIFNTSVDELLGREQTAKVEIVNEDFEKHFNKLVLKIKILSSDGDKVNVNIPLPLVKVCIESGMDIPQVSGNINISSIDFKQIYKLIEQGVVGELVSIESADGDIVKVVVE